MASVLSRAMVHSNLGVTTSTQEAVAENTDRLGVLLQNDSDEVIYIGIGVAAVANEGIRLDPLGGWQVFSQAQGNLVHDAINAIHAGTGTKVLLVTEW